jgi:hypothetical protein
MPAFRSLVSVLVRFVGRSFSTNSRPASGRPPAALGRQRHEESRDRPRLSDRVLAELAACGVQSDSPALFSGTD